MSDTLPPYEYSPFPVTEDPDDIYIRLMTLHPGPKTGPITCTIFETRLSQVSEHKFEAVSYCWGDPEDQFDIFIVPSSLVSARSGRVLRVNRSLEPFLYRTRSVGRPRPRTLWVRMTFCPAPACVTERASLDFQIPLDAPQAFAPLRLLLTNLPMFAG